MCGNMQMFTQHAVWLGGWKALCREVGLGLLSQVQWFHYNPKGLVPDGTADPLLVS